MTERSKKYEFDDIKNEKKIKRQQNKIVKNPTLTPNIDQIRAYYNRLTGSDPQNIDLVLFDRANSQELCNWTNKVLKYLPNVNDTPENESHVKDVVSHFRTIKKFYATFKDFGMDVPEIEVIFNCLQIYESVMSVGFVIFQEHPNAMNQITKEINNAINEVEKYDKEKMIHLVINLICCGNISLLAGKFGGILTALDRKIDEFNLVRVAEFITNIAEVFCKLISVDLQDMSKIIVISESIQDMIRSITSKLSSVFGNHLPNVERKKKWGPLEITHKIREKMSKFENKSPLVDRTVKSFERLFASIEHVDDDFSKLIEKQELTRVSVQTSGNAVDVDNEGFQRVNVSQLMAVEIVNSQSADLNEIVNFGRFFQHLETILTYGILIFSNEDTVLNPLLDEIDECTRILTKFNGLHVLYKIVCGRNYLSKLKVVIKKIIHLFENSKLKINSPNEFIKELSKTYPNLLKMLIESILPDKIENAIGDVFDLIKKKLKN